MQAPAEPLELLRLIETPRLLAMKIQPMTLQEAHNRTLSDS